MECVIGREDCILGVHSGEFSQACGSGGAQGPAPVVAKLNVWRKGQRVGVARMRIHQAGSLWKVGGAHRWENARSVFNKGTVLKVWAGCQESTKAGQCPESCDGCLVTVSKPGGCRWGCSGSQHPKREAHFPGGVIFGWQMQQAKETHQEMSRGLVTASTLLPSSDLLRGLPLPWACRSQRVWAAWQCPQYWSASRARKQGEQGGWTSKQKRSSQRKKNDTDRTGEVDGGPLERDGWLKLRLRFIQKRGFPGSSDGETSAYNVGDPGSIPG